MGYLIFRGVSTASLQDVVVVTMPSHRKASMRYTEYYVKGRDGALHVDEGLANFDLPPVRLGLLRANTNARQLVNAWADGTGKLITSDDLTRAYKATVKEEIEWSRDYANGGFYDVATITFNCQPYMYEAQDSVITLTQTGALLNPGSATALPLIQVNGSGFCSFTMNGTTVGIDGVTSGVPVYIDCENGYVWTESGPAAITGEFPELGMGGNAVTLNSGITSLVVTPHWRWI